MLDSIVFFDNFCIVAYVLFMSKILKINPDHIENEMQTLIDLIN